MSHERWATLGTGSCPTARKAPIVCLPNILGIQVCTPRLCDTVAGAVSLVHTLLPSVDVHLYDASNIN